MGFGLEGDESVLLQEAAQAIWSVGEAVGGELLPDASVAVAPPLLNNRASGDAPAA